MSHGKIDYVDLMRAKGHRVTPQRLIILDAICEIGGHATFGAIYQRVKAVDRTIDQSTIYRTLDFLCEMGLVVSAEIGDQGRVYEIAGQTPHHHLVCKVCGGIQPLEHETLTALCESIRQKYDFAMQVDHLVLAGICAKCRAEFSADDTPAQSVS